MTTGDFGLSAHVSGWNAEASTSSIGLMARASLAPGAPAASIIFQKTPTGGRYRLLMRLVEGSTAQGSSLDSLSAADAWLRLERRVDDITAWTSVDWVDWTELDRATIAMPPEIQVGIAAVDGRGSQGRNYAVARV